MKECLKCKIMKWTNSTHCASRFKSKLHTNGLEMQDCLVKGIILTYDEISKSNN